MAAGFISSRGCDFSVLCYENLGISHPPLQVFVEISDSAKEQINTGQRGDIRWATATSAIDALYHIKRKMDEAGILDAKIFVPPGKVELCSVIKSLLFMDTFEVRILPCPSTLLDWEERRCPLKDYENAVTEYLKTVPSIGAINTVKSDLFPPELFRHGYTLRWGGISTHPALSSLSVTYSTKKPDSPLVARENKRRLCCYLQVDPQAFHLCRVEHGNRIWVYEKEPPEKFDGIVTNTPGVMIAAPGADCMMVLLADPVARACGAVHAGFAGVLAEALKAAVNVMANEYFSEPRNMLCTIGPCLGVCCADYHKDSTRFERIHSDIVEWKEGLPHVDLRMAARLQLGQLGLCRDNIDDGISGRVSTPRLAACTKCESAGDFFSHRRDGVIFGNCIGFITLTMPNRL